MILIEEIEEHYLECPDALVKRKPKNPEIVSVDNVVPEEKKDYSTKKKVNYNDTSVLDDLKVKEIYNIKEICKAKEKIEAKKETNSTRYPYNKVMI